MGRKSKNGKSKKSNSPKRNLRKEIFNVMQFKGSQPLNYKQIAAELEIEDSNLRNLIIKILAEEKDKGKLKEVERGKYIMKGQKSEAIEGTIQITRHGRGFVLVDGQDEDIEVPRGKTGQAFYGDTVEVSWNAHARNPMGRVVRIVKRAKERYVGVVQMSQRYAFIVPSDPRIHVDFFVHIDDLNGAKDGEKVVVEMTEWDAEQDSPNGVIVEVLGRPGDNDVEMNAIMAEYGLPVAFTEEVEAEAAAIPTAISKAEVAERKDMREVLTFTIDPHDAKDFDDALSYRKLDNGNTEVGIHIADVAHYVKPGTLLDEEAVKRATSVYLVDRVVPMLPEVLSNNLCSLRPNEDKLSFSAVFELDERANIKKEWFGRTVIHSKRRFSYEEAQEVIETGKGDLVSEIQHLDKLAKTLRERRFKEGGIEFSSEEVKFRLDEKGKPIGVYTKVMKDSNRLIEDFMLLANRRVAAHVGKTKDPSAAKTFIYRIHDEPDPEKLNKLRQFVGRFGYKIPPLKQGTDAHYVINKLLHEVDGKPEADVIRTMAIRSMAKAEYSTDNIGHYGLAFDYYSHFTSPIRRYPDVMVHRLLAEYLAGGKSADQEHYQALCKHSSIQEKKATEAERSSIKYKQVEYMQAHLAEEFEGIVSGITNWGIYVELDGNKCEGMVPLQSMDDDYYTFDPETFRIYGQRKGKEFRLGTKVHVKVMGADLIKRQIDFELVG